MTGDTPTIAILGGTGSLGNGLARRWLRAEHDIVIGSRDAGRAAAAAQALADAGLGGTVRGLGNRDAADAAAIVVLAVPFASHDATLADVRDVLEGKILLDTTVPLVPPRVARVQLPEGGSVAAATQASLGDGVRVVSAFHNVAADHLTTDHEIDCDILVCGNDPEARAVVVGLAEDAGLKAWHGGAIDNSAVAEALTSVLIFINRRYKIDGAGIRITGAPRPDAAEG